MLEEYMNELRNMPSLEAVMDANHNITKNFIKKRLHGPRPLSMLSASMREIALQDADIQKSLPVKAIDCIASATYSVDATLLRSYYSLGEWIYKIHQKSMDRESSKNTQQYKVSKPIEIGTLF